MCVKMIVMLLAGASNTNNDANDKNNQKECHTCPEDEECKSLHSEKLCY